MKRLLRIILPPIILFAGIAVAAGLISTAPQTDRKRPVSAPPAVEVMTLQAQNYQVLVNSHGTVSPLVKTTLLPEVSGRIVEVSNNFRNGGFFRNGEILLRIDPRDYENRQVIARAEVAQRKQNLAEEQVRASQAKTNWEKLQLSGDPDPLALRLPQLETAQALLDAAEASLRQASLDLERTGIIAPFDGRILDKKVDIGQLVGSGTALADIYASDSVEIRLPINSDQQSFLQLPESEPSTAQTAPKVHFTARIGNRTHNWTGYLVRTEAAVDVRSRQLFVIARIDKPYQQSGKRPALKIGQFLEASIAGDTLQDVFVIPRNAVRGENTIHLIDHDNRLRRRELDVIWRDRQSLIVSGPLQTGDRLSLTTLPFAADGIAVKVINAMDDREN